MYDAMKIIIPWDRLTQTNQDFLNSSCGRMGNLHFREGHDGLVITGSLTKFFRGNNIDTPSREEYKEILRYFERETSISLKEGHVVSLETGATIEVENPPSVYLSSWGTVSNYKKNAVQGRDGCETVMFYNGTRSFSGYDKARESQKRLHFMGRKNWIRLELRNKRKMKAIHGVFPSPWQLAEYEHFKLQAKLWTEFYFSIPKGSVVDFGSVNLTPSNFLNCLAASAISQIGLDRTDSIIREQQARGVMTRSNASRCRNKVKEIHSSEACKPTFNTTELDEKVREIYDTLVVHEEKHGRLVPSQLPFVGYCAS